MWRNKQGLIASFLAPLILNAIFAAIFEGTGDMDRDKYTMQGHFGSIAQVLIGGMFGASQPLLLRFPLDRGIFLREYRIPTSRVATSLPTHPWTACQWSSHESDLTRTGCRYATVVFPG